MSAKKLKDFYLRAVDLENLGIVVAFLHGAGPDETIEARNNAALLGESLTVRNELGLTPRQLAEQRAELLEALKAIHVQAADAQLRATYQRIALEEISQRAQSAIAKCGVKP